MTRFYFDTSIWIDIYDKRGAHGEHAMKLMEKIILDDLFVVYSEVVVAELQGLGFSDFEINEMLSIAKPNHIVRVHASKHQREEAKRIAQQRKVPRGDALHAILARDNNLQLISRDNDFEQLRDITIAKRPEEFS